jgi:REDY-like protein HapK
MDATITMVVLVTLRDGVSREEYEGWVSETYRPAVVALPSVGEWRGYRADRLLASDEVPPYDYVVTLEVTDPERLGADMASEEMQALLARVHELVEVVQILSTRFA